MNEEPGANTRVSDSEETPRKRTGKFTGATLVVVALAMTVTQMIAAATQGIPILWEWSTGGLVAVVSSIAMWIWCPNWASWRKWIWLPVGITVALTFVAVNLMATSARAEAEQSTTSPSGATAQPSAGAIEQIESNAALEAMNWIDNGDGVAPDLEATTPVDFTVSGARLISDGGGEVINVGQLLALDYVIKSGADGSTLYSTYDNGGPEQVLYITGEIDPAIETVLKGAHVGVDFLYAVPDQGQGANIMMVTVASVRDVLERAEGTAVAPVAGLPKVTLADNGAPSVSYPTTTTPDGFVAQDLITGSGSVVKDGQSVTVHYTGWLWNGDQFDSSWDRGAPSTFTLTAGGIIDGWVQGLVGKTVGSQVLLVVPPDLGYGDEGSGDTIPGGSTLVFVVDILAAN